MQNPFHSSCIVIARQLVGFSRYCAEAILCEKGLSMAASASVVALHLNARSQTVSDDVSAIAESIRITRI